jgi:hypothetical protein
MPIKASELENAQAEIAQLREELERARHYLKMNPYQIQTTASVLAAVEKALAYAS